MKFSATVLAAGFAGLMLTSSLPAAATVVLVKTNLGNFEVNLFDQTTPLTVANFLTYVNNGSYNDTLFHRSLPGFVLQGGGFKYSGNNTAPFTATAVLAPVKNEVLYSNLRGTIAMAKQQGKPDSATNQWFINLADNSQNLDTQNSGFTVFGQVTGNGMEIIDAIAKLPTNLATGFAEVPLRNYTAADVQAKVPVAKANLIHIESISVINNDPASAAALKPVRNTLIHQNKKDDSSSGGSLGWLSLLAVAALACCRRRSSRLAR